MEKREALEQMMQQEKRKKYEEKRSIFEPPNVDPAEMNVIPR